MSREHYAVLQSVLTGQPVEGVKTLGNSPAPWGWAAEFGVASGTSLDIISRHMPVVGFDSFQGLPENWREGFPKGMFTRDGYVPQVPPNAMIVAGLFEDTVHRFPFPTLGLVHIDCDLYSSTVTALDAVAEYITTGTIIVFDEYHGYDGWEEHEAKAWREFLARTSSQAEPVAMGEQAKAFVITSMWGAGYV